ncbi:hypothetical protein AAVH_05751 [Aphelenchoides avenae]|nr:hypothetical protein AAVH_05751 [Aphelenchus avenae]
MPGLVRAIAPTSEIHFADVPHKQTQRLVLRNLSDQDIVVKIRTSNAALLQLSRPFATVTAGDQKALSVTLVRSGSNATNAKEDSLSYISVYCRALDWDDRPTLKYWLRSDDQCETELALRLKVILTTGFVSPMTVLDLPAYACLDTVRATGYDMETAIDIREDVTEPSAYRSAPVTTSSATKTATPVVVRRPVNRLCRCSNLFETLFPNPPRNARQTTVRTGGVQ